MPTTLGSCGREWGRERKGYKRLVRLKARANIETWDSSRLAENSATYKARARRVGGSASTNIVSRNLRLRSDILPQQAGANPGYDDYRIRR